MPSNDTGRTVKCWGCECEVPLLYGMHYEETDIPNTVYTYPCTRPSPVAVVGDSFEEDDNAE